MNKMPILFLLILIGSTAPSYAQEFSISSSAKSVEKGERFRLFLEIKTDDATIHNLKIDEQPPIGFTLDKKEPIPEISEIISPGSHLLITYIVTTPEHLPAIFKQDKRGISTREPKDFIFNISYSEGQGKELRRRAIKYELRYTTSIYYYIFWGLVGLFLAHIIKSLAKKKSEQQSKGTGFKFIVGYIFSKNLVALMTTLLIGFAVIIVLARDMVPTRGWYDTIALGIVLGMLGDENLLGKLKGT